MMGNPFPEPVSGQQVRVSRFFAIARELVFKAWIDPDQIAAWWAPEGCEVPRDSVEIDPRVGGRIHFSIVDPERRAAIPVRFEIVEISKPELLVLASEPEPEIGLPHSMLTRVLFEVDRNGTRVTVTQGPHTDEMKDRASAGWLGSLDKLQRLLGS